MTKLERAIRWALPELEYAFKPGMCYDPGTAAIISAVGAGFGAVKTFLGMFQGAPDSRAIDHGDGDRRAMMPHEPAVVADPDENERELRAQREMSRRQNEGRTGTAMSNLEGELGTGGQLG